LLDHASGNERVELSHQRTPPRLADLARAALAELRLNRAYEGQHLTIPPNLDSERLALNTLRVQPGWSPNMRLEARHLTADGEKWLQIGADDAPLLRTLVRTADGRYVPHDEKGPLFGETDLYTAILNALPDAQRNALGFHVNQGPALQQRLRQHPLPRDELRQVLVPEVIRPPDLETLIALGNDAGYPVQAGPVALPLTLEQRARALYPSFDALQINGVLNYLHTQPGGTANGLAALAEEYRQLDSDLSTWQRQVIVTHPETGQPLSAFERSNERQNRRMIAKELRRCWRRETAVDDYFDAPSVDGHSLRLEYPILGALPDLTANFNHVSLLTLSGHPQTTGASTFIQRFRQLRHLSVRGFNLGTVPDGIFTLPRLNALSLSSCHISLTPESQTRIASLRSLQTLELHDNPLGLAPSVENMPDLIHLDLSNTGIEQLPAGALTRPELQVALLNDNQIQTLPHGFFELPPHKADTFLLSDNPLSRATLEQVKRYYQRHGTAFGADALPSDARDAHSLYPSLGETELNRLIYSLPGTLEDGQIELARRAAELETLQGQLTRWEQASGTAPQEVARRIALRRLLENSWRRELSTGSRQRHSLIIPHYLAGELPTLDASFTHITSLTIRGNDVPINVDSFLDSFPELRAISLDRARLGDIPPAICALPKLEFLDLENCSVHLTQTSRANLKRMTQLKHLSLSNNPLGETVDFSQLTQLTTLYLRDTGLSAVPPSLLTETPRDRIDLTGNSITQLPPELFALPGHISQAFDLSANPLTRQALEQVKTYCQRTDVFFNIQTPAMQRGRAKQLYPKMQEKDLNQLIFGLPGDLDGIDNALAALEADYHQLVADLQHWADDIPAQHPLVGGALEDAIRVEEELNRLRLKHQLEKAWRRETPEDTESLDDHFSHAVVLDVPIIGTLPVLRARFEHVTSLEIAGAFTITDVNGTLTSFGALRTLIVNHCTLRELPPAIFNMPHLDTLDLSHCEISLTTAAARALGDLHDLEYLHLGNNPLNNAPDVTHLQQLSSLHLPHTKISEVPAGVFQLPLLQSLDLSHNTIKEIPPQLMEMLQVFDNESDLRGNPWSPKSLRRLREYYRQTGIDFQIHEITVDENGAPLVPESDDAMDEE
jgi:Leucine-rich repeat (LRR) protein